MIEVPIVIASKLLGGINVFNAGIDTVKNLLHISDFIKKKSILDEGLDTARFILLIKHSNGHITPATGKWEAQQWLIYEYRYHNKDFCLTSLAEGMEVISFSPLHVNIEVSHGP